MSLLMDALKKAEMAKRQGAAESGREPFKLSDDKPGSVANSLSLEPVVFATPPATPPVTPQVSEPLASIGGTDGADSNIRAAESSTARLASEFSDYENFGLAALPVHTPSASANAAARLATPGAEQARTQTHADQRSAQNLFQAKQTQSQVSAKTPPVFAIAVGSTTILAVAAIGAYFWWQLQPRSNVGLMPTPAAMAPTVAPVSVPAHASGSGAAPAMAPAPAPITASIGATVNDKAMDEISPAASTGTKTPARKKALSPAPVPEDERSIHVTRTPLRVNPGLGQAFDAAQRGDWASAQKAYAAVLATDPHNAEALHGLANIAQRENKPAEAERYLQRLLLANPQDANASAALTHLYARSHPEQAESKLKALTQAQPELAAASIALGNLYAGQGRWAEAQQAYFSAYASQPDNPDLLFNLAISLEHLNQPKLAVQYYKEALQAATRWPASFSAAQADERLRALQP